MGKMVSFILAFVFTYLSMSIQAAATPETGEKKAAVVVTAPMVAPTAALPVPSPTPEIKTVDEVKLTVRDESMVPPDWVQDAIMTAKSLPVIGPFLVTALQWLAMIASILTALFAFLWTVLRSGQALLSAAKLFTLAEKLAAMENSKFMYYLKALSMFNAQKKDKPA